MVIEVPEFLEKMHNAQEGDILGKAGTRVQLGSANTSRHLLGAWTSAMVLKMQTEELECAAPRAMPDSTVPGLGTPGSRATRSRG